MSQIGVFSLEADLHAHAIKHELAKLGMTAHFFATDAQIDEGGLSWSSSSEQGAVLRNYDGEMVPVRDLSVVWWRRVNQPQKDPEKFGSSTEFDLICNEWKGALFGAVSDSFEGIWVNDPKFDALAGNKIYHLKVAKRAGLSIPDTLVTNDSEQALAFCRKHDDQVIAKKILGGANLSLATIEVNANSLAQNSSGLTVCPVMFQEKINAKSHIRANCFGDQVYAVEILSNDLDWRRNLNCEFRPYQLPDDISAKLVQLLLNLNLQMGVMDLIVTDDEIIWLEINPQGQFLFAEGLSGMNLKKSCAMFFKGLAEQAVSTTKVA